MERVIQFIAPQAFDAEVVLTQVGRRFLRAFMRCEQIDAQPHKAMDHSASPR